MRAYSVLPVIFQVFVSREIRSSHEFDDQSVYCIFHFDSVVVNSTNRPGTHWSSKCFSAVFYYVIKLRPDYKRIRDVRLIFMRTFI